jgi:TfoX/Sxy family transcriptional regulator of competence genes
MRKPSTAPKRSEPAHVDPNFARVVDAFAQVRGVTYGKMFAAMGLKVNGKIFAMHAQGKFVAKLPKERVDELVRAGKGEYFDPGHGRLMKEWIALDGAQPSWVDLAREAHTFVRRGAA